MQVHRGRSSLSFPDSTGVLEPLALACTPQVDPGEDHGQLRRPEFDAVGFGGAGHLEASCLEPLVPDRQAITIEEEDLDAISPPIEEEEEMTGQGILAEAFLDQPVRPSKLLRRSVARVQRK